MFPDYEPSIPEWFHQQFELERFLAEARARVDAEEREARKRRGRYFAATSICWLVAGFILLISTRTGSPVRATRLGPSPPVVSSAAAPLSVAYIQGKGLTSPLLSESDELKQVLDQLGAIEVQGSLSTRTGECYRGPLWIRKVKRGETVYLEDAALFAVDGPFRLRLPSNSTVYVYAPTRGLDWNSGWGVPIQTPPCSQPGGCALRLEDLIASTGR